MKKDLFLILVCLCNAVCLFSQNQPSQSKQKNTRFQSYNTIGLLTGEQTVSASLQSVNGIQWKSLFAGAGLGFDFYGIGTTPLFLDLRKTFGKGRKKFFAYGDAGYNIAWPGTTAVSFSSSLTEQKGGFYSDIGIGYLVGFGKNDALVLSAGHSFKSLSDNLVAYPLCVPGVICEPTTERNEYHFNRISIKAGWRF